MCLHVSKFILTSYKQRVEIPVNNSGKRGTDKSKDLSKIKSNINKPQWMKISVNAWELLPCISVYISHHVEGRNSGECNKPSYGLLMTAVSVKQIVNCQIITRSVTIPSARGTGLHTVKRLIFLVTSVVCNMWEKLSQFMFYNQRPYVPMCPPQSMTDCSIAFIY